MNMVSRRLSRLVGPVMGLGLGMFVVVAAVTIPAARPAQAQTATQIKVACLGEASTHSAHRNYDPEYPELMGMYLDSDFRKDASPQHPLAGGMLYGGGTNYRIGNFGIPTGRVIETNLSNPQSVITSDQLRMAESWNPHIVILGPFGPHEALAGGNVATFLPGLRRLVERVVAFPSKPTVYIALPLPRWGMDGEANRRRFNMETAQVIRETGLPSIDFWTPFLGKMGEFADQNHLNLMGRQHMADVAGAVIKTWRPGQGAGGAGGSGLTGTGGAGAGSDGGVSDGARPADGPATGSGGANTAGSGGVSGSATGGTPATSTGGSGTGGVQGTGGADATGGVVGTGGATNTGGAIGSGGATSGTGGATTAGSGGRASPDGPGAGDPGCACTSAGRGGSGSGTSVVLLAFALLGLLPRRRPARSSR